MNGFQRTSIRSVFRGAASPGIIAVLAVTLIFSCTWEPERDNPADPGSELFRNEGTFNVSIQSLTNSPLSNVMVVVEENGVVGYTDIAGQVELRGPLGWLYLRALREDYTSVRDSILVRYDGTSEITLQMNGTPVIDSLVIRSGIDEEQASAEFRYFFIVYQYFHDPDLSQELDAWFIDPGTGERVELDKKSSTLFVDSLLLGSLSTGRAALIERLGKPVRAFLSDAAGDSDQVSGVLEQYFFYPNLRNDMQTTWVNADDARFRWRVPELDFQPLRYRFELFAQEGLNLVMDTTIAVVTDTLSESPYEYRLQLEESISPGGYYWRLILYDSLGNWVRAPLKTVSATP